MSLPKVKPSSAFLYQLAYTKQYIVRVFRHGKTGQQNDTGKSVYT
jgi:hypothetical protein